MNNWSGLYTIKQIVYYSGFVILVASATAAQRRTDDDLDVEVSGPDALPVARRRATKKQLQILPSSKTLDTNQNEDSHGHDESTTDTSAESKSHSYTSGMT